MTLILAYHGVADKVPEGSRWIEYGERKYDLEKLCVLPDLFEKQLSFLYEQGYQSISLEDLIKYRQEGLKPSKKSIIITFDDGFKNCFNVVLPALKKYGFTATIFLVTNKIGRDSRFLSWEEILKMKKQGFSFGVHTCSHPLLTSLTLERAKEEIEQSKKIIEAKLGSSVNFFSYPYGEFNQTIQVLVKEAGFWGAVVTPHGPGIEEGFYSLKRVGINRDNSMLVFKFKMSGLFSWIREHRLLWKILTKTKSLQR